METAVFRAPCATLPTALYLCPVALNSLMRGSCQVSAEVLSGRVSRIRRFGMVFGTIAFMTRNSARAALNRTRIYYATVSDSLSEDQGVSRSRCQIRCV
jgi:hypothetical protein